MDKDGKSPGDEQRPAKRGNRKRTPGAQGASSARKRTPNPVQATEQNGATATEPEVAETRPGNDRSAVADRPATDRSTAGRAMGDQPAPREERGRDGGHSNRDADYGNRDADRAAEVAADLKSWLDTRREDREAPREVL